MTLHLLKNPPASEDIAHGRAKTAVTPHRLEAPAASEDMAHSGVRKRMAKPAELLLREGRSLLHKKQNEQCLHKLKTKLKTASAKVR